MINARTLSKIYPPVQGRTLTPVQIISLHLLLHRPPENGHSSDPTFGPFIDTMPTRFDSHPLVWVVAGELGIESKRYCQSLLASLPPSTSSSLRELTTGFWEDWDAVRNYMVRRFVSILFPSFFYDDHVFDRCHVRLQAKFPPVQRPLWAGLNRRIIF